MEDTLDKTKQEITPEQQEVLGEFHKIATVNPDDEEADQLVFSFGGDLLLKAADVYGFELSDKAKKRVVKPDFYKIGEREEYLEMNNEQLKKKVGDIVTDINRGAEITMTDDEIAEAITEHQEENNGN